MEIDKGLFIIYLCVSPFLIYYLSWCFIVLAVNEGMIRAREEKEFADGLYRIPLCTKDYKEIMDDADTADFCENSASSAVEVEKLEEQWKKRVLIEFVADRGNILMNYDFHRKAFTYYSDTQSIPYEILNEIVRKYVIMFRCRDFYEDGLPIETPKNTVSAAPNVMYKTNQSLFSSGAVKSISVQRRRDNTSVSVSAAPAPPELKKNKIIRIGKMSDFSFLDKAAKTNKLTKKDINFKEFMKSRNQYESIFS